VQHFTVFFVSEMLEHTNKSEVSNKPVKDLSEAIKEELRDKAVSMFMDFGQATRFVVRNSSSSENLKKAAKNFAACEPSVNASNEVRWNSLGFVLCSGVQLKVCRC
jgi:hypothetical protein